MTENIWIKTVNSVTKLLNRVNRLFLIVCVKVHRNGLRIERAGPYSRRMSIDSIWS